MRTRMTMEIIESGKALTRKDALVKAAREKADVWVAELHTADDVAHEVGDLNSANWLDDRFVFGIIARPNGRCVTVRKGAGMATT